MVVTGAGRKGGLGQGIATRFVEAGASLVLVDIGTVAGRQFPEHGVATKTELEEVGEAVAGDSQGAVLSYTCDVRDEQQVEELMSFAVEELGRIDVLVNNAGVGYLMAPVTEVDEADWDAVLDVNLKGTFLCTKHAARAMIDQGTGGCIVNISSQGGKSGFPEASAYVSSKHGVIGFTRSASMDLAPHGIRVNAVCPNHVTTGLGRWQNDTSPGGPVSRCPSTSRACEHGSPSVVTELLGTPPTRASSWPVMRRSSTSPARPERFGGEETH